MIFNDNLIDTSIHWIGKIPNTWGLGRVKNLTYVKARIGWQGMRSDEFVDNTDWFCVTGTDFKKGSIDWSNCYCIEEWRYNQDKKIQLKLNDILITKDGTIGKVALIDDLPKKTTLNSGVFVTRPYFKAYKTEYFFWLLSSNVFKEFINYFKNGSTILHLYQNVFERFIFPIPSNAEQTQIANYLDTKTTAIDKKVNLLQQKIKHYKAYRKTLINEAVTKGLDITVKLKDSGINWIGKIPEHWVVKRLKEVSKNMGSGATPLTSNPENYKKGNIYWVNTGDLNNGIVLNSKRKISNQALINYPNLITYNKGTLIIAMYGATIGKLGLLGIDATTNQACCCINLNKHHTSKFIFYWLLSNKQNIISLSVGGTQPNISQSIVGKLLLNLPPKVEQQQIADYLDAKTATIDNIVKNIETQITTLKELRKTLINDVVTGKIKITQ